MPRGGARSTCWPSSPAGVLEFVRGHGPRCVANISGEPVDLGRRTTVLLSSAPLVDGLLAPDATAWLV
jgi:alpha-glucosidase